MKKTKKYTTSDVVLIELSAMAFILFFIRVWPAAMALVHKIHWGWFLAASVLLAIKPMMSCMKK